MAFAVPILSEGLMEPTPRHHDSLILLATLPRCAARWRQCHRSRRRMFVCKNTGNQLRTTLILILVIWILHLMCYHKNIIMLEKCLFLESLGLPYFGSLS